MTCTSLLIRYLRAEILQRVENCGLLGLNTGTLGVGDGLRNGEHLTRSAPSVPLQHAESPFSEEWEWVGNWSESQ